MPSVAVIAVPVGIFLALIFVVLMYTWKEHARNKDIYPLADRIRPQPAPQPVVQNTTVVYTIPTIRQLEVMFPRFTDITIVQYNDQLPPAYADVSGPPPSYDQIQIDVRVLDVDKASLDKASRQNSIT